MSYTEQLQKDWDTRYENCFFSKKVIERLTLLNSSRFGIGQKVVYKRNRGYGVYEVIGIFLDKTNNIIIALQYEDYPEIYTANEDELEHDRK